MSTEKQSIKTIVARLATDKPVRKTSYQVKGVLIKDFRDQPIIPLIDGTYREQFLYPRVQVKILNEQIYFVGIKEGVEPIQVLMDSLKVMNFGNITFEIESYELEVEENRFGPSTRMIRYKFLTPWVALNETNLMKYKYLYGEERVKILTRLLSQNIVFLSKEMELDPRSKVYSKLNLESLYPRLVDDGQMGSFQGEFRSNFVLPNFLGIGNGITKGYGVIFSHFNPADFSFDEREIKKKSHKKKVLEEMPENWEEEAISPDDIPRSHRKTGKKEKKDPNYNTVEYHKRKH